MPANLAEVRAELALANRIVAHEGIIDAFGHVSVRHPDNPNRYFLSRSRAPELVTARGSSSNTTSNRSRCAIRA